MITEALGTPEHAPRLPLTHVGVDECGQMWTNGGYSADKR